MKCPAARDAEGSAMFLSPAVRIRIATIPGREER
jgi:hypothetical protein